MQLSLIIADFAYGGAQRSCLFYPISETDRDEVRGRVGRDQRLCRLLIEGDLAISRHHFDVRYRQGKFWLLNLSRNGTTIVGKPMLEEGQESEISNNDRIQIGQTELIATLMPTPGRLPEFGVPPSARAEPAAPGFDNLFEVGAGASMGTAPGWAAASASAPGWDVAPNPRSPSAPAFPTRAGNPPPVRARDTGDPLFFEAPNLAALPEFLPAFGGANRDIPEDLDLERLLGGSSGDPGNFARPAEPVRAEPVRPEPIRPPAIATVPAQPAVPSVRSEPPPAVAAVSDRNTLARIFSAAGLMPERAAALAASSSPEAVGQLLESLIEGLTTQLMVRDNFKRVYRLSVTEIRASGNNPLKLPVAPAERLVDILNPRPGFIGGVDAVKQATWDLQVHQAAVAECMRLAFLALVQSFDPKQFDSAVSSSMLTMIAGGKDAAAWRSFRDFYDSRFADLHRAFLTLFVDRFGRDYETQTARMQDEFDKGSKRSR